jgi:tRNA(Ile)-lysidine synthase
MVSEKTARHPLEYAIGKILIQQDLVRSGERLLVGVSAGADSMALLHLLAAHAKTRQLHLVAAYVDHGLRPRETPLEWACVREAARSLGCAADRVMVRAREAAAQKGQSLEHAARELRYQAFTELGKKWETEILAVAHTADDQVEEVLLRLLRGSGRKALSGMRLRSGQVIRPLLGVRKQELVRYLSDREISFCCDSSNEDRRFLRNRIRLDLLPLLESDYDPGVRQALLKTAANLQEDEDLLEGLLEECWPQVVAMLPAEEGLPAARLDRRSFGRLHVALQRRLLEKLLWAVESAARFEQILAIRTLALEGQVGQELHLSKGLRVRVSRDALLFSYPQGRGPWRGRLYG